MRPDHTVATNVLMLTPRRLTSRAAHAASALFLAAAAPASLAAQGGGGGGATATPVVFEGVSVVPMDREQVLANQTVVVRDGRIVYVGDAKGAPPTPGAQRVAGNGKFLMPGLAEMHAHIPGGQAPPEVPRRVLELFALNGVTQIRGMLGDPLHLTLRQQVERGELLGPRIVVGGPSLNGNSVATPAQAAAAVTAQKSAGYDLLKIHPGIKREVFDTLAATADRVGIRFAGHVPFDVGVRRAIESKFASIEHLDGYLEAMVPASRTVTEEQIGFFGSGISEFVDLSQLPALVADTKRNGVLVAPTEALMVNMASEESVDEMVKRPEMKYWFPNQVSQWANATRSIRANPTFDAAHRSRFRALRKTLIRAMRDGGVGFILASDAPQMWNVPGFSTTHELVSLVAAGLTPYEALRSGTVNVAAAIGESKDAGTVERGKRADLILLDGNPLADVRHVGRPAGVMLRGKWLGREELDRRLAALEIAR